MLPQTDWDVGVSAVNDANEMIVDGQRKATAQALQVNNVVTFPFHDSLLEISEVNEGVILVNRILVNCPVAVLAAYSSVGEQTFVSVSYTTAYQLATRTQTSTAL